MVKLIRKTEPRQKEKGHALAHAPRRVNLSKILGDAEKAIAAAQVPEEAFGVDKQLHALPGLLVAARPWWYAASRKAKHRKLAAQAVAARLEGLVPFPLIYADPPWKFQIYSEKGLERTPDQHYPTLTDQEIIDFRIGDRTVPEIAASDAALFLWCTSSNIPRAIAVMEAWDFEFKTSAVWNKQKTGLGLVFRNQHEVLLYGTRGKMPGPQFQPPSVFSYPRGRHSAKPPEIRRAIEKMYPDFDKHTRLELFARESVKGWTCYGFEAFGANGAAVNAEALATVIEQGPRIRAENDAADRSEPPRRRRA